MENTERKTEAFDGKCCGNCGFCGRNFHSQFCTLKEFDVKLNNVCKDHAILRTVEVIGD